MHLAQGVARGGRGHQQYIDVTPHHGRYLAQASQLGLCFEQIRSAVLLALGNDASNGFDHRVRCGVEKVSNGLISLSHKCTFVKQSGSLFKRCITDDPIFTAQRFKLINTLLESLLAKGVTKEFKLIRHAKDKAVAKGFGVQVKVF